MHFYDLVLLEFVINQQVFHSFYLVQSWEKDKIVSIFLLCSQFFYKIDTEIEHFFCYSLLIFLPIIKIRLIEVVEIYFFHFEQPLFLKL